MLASVSTTRTLDAWGWIFAISGGLCAANALWMLVGPMHWYNELPAAVPDTGPFNPHFVRDLGCAFLTTGAALVWAAFAPRWRPALVPVAALFLCGHALVHVYDTLRGALADSHWAIDLPGVYLPALILGYAAVAQRGRAQMGDA